MKTNNGEEAKAIETISSRPARGPAIGCTAATSKTALQVASEPKERCFRSGYYSAARPGSSTRATRFVQQANPNTCTLAKGSLHSSMRLRASAVAGPRQPRVAQTASIPREGCARRAAPPVFFLRASVSGKPVQAPCRRGSGASSQFGPAHAAARRLCVATVRLLALVWGTRHAHRRVPRPASARRGGAPPRVSPAAACWRPCCVRRKPRRPCHVALRARRHAKDAAAPWRGEMAAVAAAVRITGRRMRTAAAAAAKAAASMPPLPRRRTVAQLDVARRDALHDVSVRAASLASRPLAGPCEPLLRRVGLRTPSRGRLRPPQGEFKGARAPF